MRRRRNTCSRRLGGLWLSYRCALNEGSARKQTRARGALFTTGCAREVPTSVGEHAYGENKRLVDVAEWPDGHAHVGSVEVGEQPHAGYVELQRRPEGGASRATQRIEAAYRPIVGDP